MTNLDIGRGRGAGKELDEGARGVLRHETEAMLCDEQEWQMRHGGLTAVKVCGGRRGRGWMGDYVPSATCRRVERCTWSGDGGSVSLKCTGCSPSWRARTVHVGLSVAVPRLLRWGAVQMRLQHSADGEFEDFAQREAMRLLEDDEVGAMLATQCCAVVGSTLPPGGCWGATRLWRLPQRPVVQGRAHPGSGAGGKGGSYGTSWGLPLRTMTTGTRYKYTVELEGVSYCLR